MIILDAKDQERSKQLNDPFLGGPTLRFPEKAAARSDSPLPDYETSEAHQKLIAKELSSPRRSDKRLWRSILYALAIYVLLTIVIVTPILLVKKHHSNTVPVNLGPSWDTEPNNGGASMSVSSAIWDITNNGQCQWDSFEPPDSPSFTAHVSHTFNYSGSFYIQSNITDGTNDNDYSSGDLTVDLNPDPTASRVVFNVDVGATSDDLLRHIQACFVNSGSSRGVLLYVTRPLGDGDYVEVNIQVLLPMTAPLAPLDNFVTSLPSFSHTFGDLSDHLPLKNLVVQAGGYDVYAGSLKASTISVKNSYAAILGDYYATSSLTLDGIKGDINTSITLEQLSSSTSPTALFLDTGDGAINANVSLIAPSLPKGSSSSSYMFVANVQTFNGPLSFRAAYTNSTPPTPLQLTAQNTDGATDVSLDRNFQGNFSVQSKLAKVAVYTPYVSPALDPLGERRPYNYLTQQSSTNQISGWVGWGKQPQYNVAQGQVKVSTSLSPITLELAAS
ncbi:hypothetical protein H0H92_008787 [Tricholoma furcatifolium]|nr:hypothetical protein H0H92_008787 [Tricholoma furcatifolium]